MYAISMNIFSFPEIPLGNTHSPSIMVAEKISDDVKEDHGESIDNPEYCP